jgi:K+ transporter
METPNVLAALRLLDPTQTEGAIAIDDASYFLSKLDLTKGAAPTMAPWRKHLFIATSSITADAADLLRPAPRPHGHHGFADRGLGFRASYLAGLSSGAGGA